METSKPWWTSLGVWGGIVTIIAPALGLLFHITLGVEETNAIAVDLVGIATGIGGLISIYGRVTATQTLTLRRDK